MSGPSVNNIRKYLWQLLSLSSCRGLKKKRDLLFLRETKSLQHSEGVFRLPGGEKEFFPLTTVQVLVYILNLHSLALWSFGQHSQWQISTKMDTKTMAMVNTMVVQSAWRTVGSTLCVSVGHHVFVHEKALPPRAPVYHVSAAVHN